MTTDTLRKVTYTGKVVYPDGRPAPGVEVAISSARDYVPLLLPHHPPFSVTQGTTDESGKYRIEAAISQSPEIFANVERDGRDHPEFAANAPASNGQLLRLEPWSTYLAKKNIKN